MRYRDRVVGIALLAGALALGGCAGNRADRGLDPRIYRGASESRGAAEARREREKEVRRREKEAEKRAKEAQKEQRKESKAKKEQGKQKGKGKKGE